MKIGFDAKRLFNNFTGLGNYSRTLLHNLQEFQPNNQYVLYAPKYKSSPETDPFLNPPFNAVIPNSVMPFWRSWLVTSQLKKDKLDIFHGLSHELPLNIKKAGVKSVVTIHDMIYKRYPETFPMVDRNIYDFKFRRACANADTIIAISESTRKDIIHYFDVRPEKVKVVYQSCNPIYYQESSLSAKEIKSKYQIPDEFLLFVGSVETRKNVKLLIQAYQYLPKDLRIPLVIVGRPRNAKEIITLIEATGMQDVVIWIKDLSNNAHLQVVYQEAMALVYPSFYEGFGLPVVEALLSKTPVITSNVSSLPEAGGADSLYIDPNDPVDLAEAIKKVLVDTNLRRTMIDKGYAYAHSRFGRSVVTEALMRVYKG